MKKEFFLKKTKEVETTKKSSKKLELQEIA